MAGAEAAQEAVEVEVAVEVVGGQEAREVEQLVAVDQELELVPEVVVTEVAVVEAQVVGTAEVEAEAPSRWGPEAFPEMCGRPGAPSAAISWHLQGSSPSTERRLFSGSPEPRSARGTRSEAAPLTGQ